MEITIEHLTKRFGDTVAVNDLSLTLESGKLIALLGPSGCGKSTTLNMLSGILPVSSGKILFDGQDVTALPPEKRGIGLVFQNYALYPHMTVRQNICFPMEIKKIPKKQRLQRAEELAELVHITEYMDRKPAELSGGQQQRVAIARALSKDPQVLLLDEPLSNLDAKLRVEMREEIRRIQKESQITTVFVTHDQEEASSIADQVVLLKDGVKQQEDSARMLYENPSNFFVADFLGTPPINKLYGKIKDGQILLEGYEKPVDFAPAAKLADDVPVILALRAEAMLACVEKPAFSGQILERYTVGKDELVRLSLGESQQLRAYVPAELNVAVGEQMDVGLKSKGVFLFHRETGERYL